MNNASNAELPQSWSAAELQDLADLVRGVSYKKEDASASLSEGLVPLLRATNITGSSLTFEGLIYVPRHYVSSDQALRLGDIIIASSSGSKEVVGKAGQLERKDGDITFGAFCTAIRPSPAMDYKYLGYYFQSPAYREAISDISAGSNINNVKSSELSLHVVPVAPRPEQTRIVEKLEELLSDVSAGVDELRAAQRKLGQYRQSLLKAAVEGALTAEWREGNSPPQEAGDVLLGRILTERRTRWERMQLSRFAKQGKTPPKDWKAKYREPVGPDLNDLPRLPLGWTWASLDQLTEIQGGIQKQPSRAPLENRYPFLRVANVARGHLKLDEIHEIELFEGELERLVLQKGDILVVEGNGSLTEIGRCALWDGSIENAVHQNHLIRARPILVKGEFIETWLNSLQGIERMTTLAATTSGLYTLSVGKISKIPIPLPPSSEQDVVMNYLAAALAGCREQAALTDRSLKQAAAQRKNILNAAFAGQLVPQDPNDEPASALLKRIRRERSTQPKPKRVRKMTKSSGEIRDEANRILAWIENRDLFTFEELKREVPAPYQTLKDSLFDLLAMDPPIIEQEFASSPGAIRFRRVNR